jgi:hypothetical protein
VPNADFAPVPEGDVAAAGGRITTAPQELRQFPDAGLTPRAVLHLQQTAGNRAVGALVQRQGVGHAPSRLLQRDEQPDTAADAEVLQWPTLLAAASRAAGQGLSVHFPDPAGKGQTQEPPTLTNEATGGVLSQPATGLSGDDATRRAQAQRIVNAIQKNRQQLDTSFLKLNSGYYNKDEKRVVRGYIWGDPTVDTTLPADLQGPMPDGDLAAKRKAAQQWVWEELAHEGGSLSINAYDEARFTWGRGMAASGGHLQSFIETLEKNEGVRDAFLRLGIRVAGGDFQIVNTANGAVEHGSEALQLMQAHPDILAAFKTVGESNRQAIADAQWSVIKTAAGKVPDAVLQATPPWPKESVQLLAHFHHAGDNFGWGKLADYIADGAPDPGALWTTFMKKLAGSPEKNGAYLVSAQTHHVAELRAWGRGAALRALAPRMRGPLTLTDKQLREAPELSGMVAMAMPDKRFLIWPADRSAAMITDDQEKTLGGGNRSAFLKLINGYSMAAMLDALKTRKTEVHDWLRGGPEIQMMSAPETNEERIWFAMRVVDTGAVPARPQGKDGQGNDLVPKGQVIEAYEWLGKKAPTEDKIK